MKNSDAAERVKKYYAIWTSGDRAAMEAALTDDFHFSSPQDDHIDKRQFFERCWPHAGEIQGFEFEDIAESGSRVLVRYTATMKKTKTRFRNTEVITFRNGKICEADVYFGRNLNSGQSESDEQQIRRVIDERAAALRALDAVKLSALYLPKARTFDLDPPLARSESAEERTRGFRAWFSTWQGEIFTEARDVQIEVSGDLAIVHALLHMRGMRKGAGESDLWFRGTTVYKKQGDRWLIAHEHSSVPFDMETLKASLDLKP